MKSNPQPYGVYISRTNATKLFGAGSWEQAQHPTLLRPADFDVMCKKYWIRAGRGESSRGRFHATGSDVPRHLPASGPPGGGRHCNCLTC